MNMLAFDFSGETLKNCTYISAYFVLSKLTLACLAYEKVKRRKLKYASACYAIIPQCWTDTNTIWQLLLSDCLGKQKKSQSAQMFTMWKIEGCAKT